MKHRSMSLLASLALVVALLGALPNVVVSAPPGPQAAFTPGNLAVYRVGDGSAALTSAATAVFLDEYTTSGTLVQSIPMPTAVSGSNRRLVAAGSATSEGYLTLSTDSNYLVLTGYDADVGTASIAGTNAIATNRVVGRVDASGTVDTSTALNDAFSTSNIRSVASTNGSDLWVSGTGSGASPGIRYTTFGSTTSTQLSTTVTNLRNSYIYAGQLYASNNSGSNGRIGAVGTGTPSTPGQTIAGLPGLPTSGSAYGFFLADLSSSVAGVDTLYVAFDDAVALTKYSLVSGSWTSNGTIGVAADAYRGLAGRVMGVAPNVTVALYATGSANRIITLSDSSGYNGAFAGTPTVLATAATNTAFRGVAFTPGTPLAVALASLQAAQQGDRIVVSWETVSELGNAGFNLYRSEDPAALGQQLNAALIPSQSPGSTGGFSYVWEDQAGLAAGSVYFYTLEDVDLSGATTRHGPVSVAFVAPTAVTVSRVQAGPAAGAAALPLAGLLLALLTPLAAAGLRRRE